MAALLIVSTALPGCAPKPAGTLTEKALDRQTGRASFYGAEDDEELFAAHPSYPRGTVARVTNLENGRKVDVRISDRARRRKYGLKVSSSICHAPPPKS